MYHADMYLMVDSYLLTALFRRRIIAYDGLDWCLVRFGGMGV